MSTENRSLAAALAEFQGDGFAVPRTRTVTVEKKSGGSYTFDYAPHELIVAAVRQPLAKRGLSVTQTLSAMPDGRPALRTILLHSSGERIEDTFPLPLREGMTAQEIGSAITYIRRYALSAILGLATEDDDDGNRASGNKVTNRSDGASPSASDGSADTSYQETEELLGEYEGTGMVRPGSAEGYKLEARVGPDGHVIGFRLEFKDDKAIPQVIVDGGAGETLFVASGMNPASLRDTRLRVKGRLFNVRSSRRASWKRLRVVEWENAEAKYPADEDAGEQPPADLPLFGDSGAAA